MSNTTTVKNVTTSSVMPLVTLPKRGIPNTKIEVLDTSIQFKPHHQKALIIELLNEGLMTLEEMVKKVSEDEKLQARLRSKQSVYNCITYHLKDLKKIGYLNLK